MMTTHSCNYGGTCWMTMALYGLAWFGLASLLLWLTWNRVVSVLFQMKKVHFFQALLVVAMGVVLLLPRWYMHKSMMMRCPYLRVHHGCCSHHSCHEESCCDEKEESKKEDQKSQDKTHEK
jgi:hypothetical protein